jgi:glucans biosynthesis protein C
MQISERRYDIDWIRVIAIVLLIVYHTAIVFQPWGVMIGFITNKETWDSLWIPMKMLNVWRIPLLFYISGMGVYYSMQNRSWQQLLLDRGKRILVPLLFGCFVIVPLQLLLLFYHYKMPFNYVVNAAHLWFLGNISIYVVVLLAPFIYITKNKTGVATQAVVKVFSHPVSILLIVLLLIGEVVLIQPVIYELYANTYHGFLLGFLCFLFGFCISLAGSSFTKMISKWKWLLLLAAIALYGWRVVLNNATEFKIFIPVESTCWILSIFAFAYQHLNRPSKVLSYLSKAAYPIYIMHMLLLFAASLLILPMQVSVFIKFPLLVLFTLTGSGIFYEFVLKRIRLLRFLTGIS